MTDLCFCLVFFTYLCHLFLFEEHTFLLVSRPLTLGVNVFLFQFLCGEFGLFKAQTGRTGANTKL